MELLKVEDLSFQYPQCDKVALKHISFAVNRGEFVTICGATGSGKSTLLRLLKRELSPLGEKSGEVFYDSTPLEELSEEKSACSIGFVMQKPEQQIVTDKVWHELAFGLENMNIPQNVIARRVAEMAGYFGIEDWYDQNVSELSGGQKQLLNLAAVMVMQPDILILDEPTAQLDPIAASDFIATLKKLNRELSLTIILVEHRLEDVIPISDKLLVLERGEVLDYDSPKLVVERLKERPEILCAMPSAARLYHLLHATGECPLDVREGRNFLEQNYANDVRSLPKADYSHSKELTLEVKEVYFRYGRKQPDVLSGLNLKIYENEIFCILGGNGSGKTTMLSAVAKLVKIYSGHIQSFGKISLLPQDVQTVFLKNTVWEELADANVEVEMLPFDISSLYDKHPYDLSGGEQQLVALAKVLATKPKILLMDEPTKGLDAYAKSKIIKMIKMLKNSGMTIVIVTHDVEFAALCADRCAMFFRGNIVSEGTPREFFAENSFYTTAVNRMTRGYYDGVSTVEDVVQLCMENGLREGVNSWKK